ncbi:hypothetical protein CHLRE_16g688650v5 [Chlamydomonas reinhardtii]|uniref:Uncharacterized protein n=1 Tax=Chlamydomonas reinhardtii TaxID=3055 RepID=A0A2K3CU52_CHLRE|nr:uncharacterized protein CHLRE_16g688650v5 [Chlamydomonas reinhardtii]PNW71801.1 hypothetical protein CHLRE_16g688650v5 [Chlamydomonas reinhardtii]
MAAPTADTFYTAPGLGAGLRGIELDRCYIGDIVSGKRHGFGTYQYPNSFFKYEGQWVNGEKHGLGKLSMRDGAYYEGEFVHGEIVGQGTRRFANGDTYIGTFNMGVMHGFGVMRLGNGDTYQGPFVQNTFHGVGVYTCANGDVYEGDFAKHQRTGQGRLTYADGSLYEGGWVGGRKCGQGEATFADGSWYKGSWANDAFHGPGEWYQAATDLTYRGEFEAGLPALLPTSLTLTWTAEEDPKAKKKPAAPAGGGKAGAPEEAQPLPVVLGEPCHVPLVVAAQLQEPLPPPAEPPPPPPDPKSKSKPPPTPPGPVSVLVLNQPPEPGHTWRTADNEFGRLANITLHSEPPKPLPAGRLLRVLVVNTLLQDGATTTVRVVISSTCHLEPPLPLTRTPAGELVACMQVELEAGQRVVEGLTVGSHAPEDWDRLVSPVGCGYLVASTREAAGRAVAPAHCKIALPDPKAKRPGAK